MTQTNTKQVIYKLLPKQVEFVNSTCKETLASGSWGSSKSTSLAFAILKEACIPGAQILLCRKTYTALKRSTMHTLLGGTNPIIPRGSYKHNKQAQTITLNGLNSTIYLMGLDEIEKVRSMNLSMVAVDEATELNENEWVELLGRLRCQEGSRRLIAACNPASPSHFLYKRFFVDNDINRKVIRSTVFDNPYLPKDYVDNLKTLPKQLYDRYVLGEWLALDKVIYSNFSREKCLKQRGLGEFTRYMVGIDWGFTHPCAIGLFGIDGDDNIHLLEEIKESGLLLNKVIKKCEKYRKFEPLVVIDPSAPALVAEFEQDGWNVKGANNDVSAGIARMQDYIERGKFTIDPGCLEFVKEIENYIYDDKGKPVKVGDDLCDMGRYVINEIVIDRNVYSKPVFYGGEDE